MIDTIRLEVTGLRPFEFFSKKLNRTVKIEGTNERLFYALKSWGSGIVVYDASGREKYEETNTRGQIERTVIFSENTGDFKEKFRIANKMSSSNYKITILVSLPDDKMVIEFSIPKYFYGNNILQICDSPLDKNFNFGKGVTDSLEHQFKSCYDKFAKHVHNFFTTEFPLVKVDYTKVCLRRIDLCYNQLFRTKEDAMQFLEEQKKYTKKNIKTSKEFNYKESVFIATKNYTFKIYHKGSEFTKNDGHKIIQAAKSKDSKLARVEVVNRLTSIADKILRYELTFRNSQLSYLYNSKLFRKDSKDFTFKKKVYNKFKYLETQGELLIEKLNDPESKFYKKVMFFNSKIMPSRKIDFKTYLIEINRKSFYRPDFEPSFMQLGKYYRNFYQAMDKLLNSNRDFLLKLPADYEEEILNDHEADHLGFDTIKEKLLSDDLFQALAKMFIDTIKEFQPQRIESTFSMVKLLNAHNAEMARKKEISKNLSMDTNAKFISPNLYKMIFLLMENRSLRDIKKILALPKTTYWRIKKNIATLGISEDAILKPMDITSDVTYNRYYTMVQDNYYTFSKMMSKKRV